MKFIRRYLSY